MDNNIRYDLFYALELTQYTNYIRQLAWALRRPNIIENFIEDLSHGRSKEYYAVDPPGRYYIDAYDNRYVKAIKANYYSKSFREDMYSPYLGILVVNTKDVIHRCPHFNQDAVSVLDECGKPEYVEYIGSTLSRGFIPVDERRVPYFFFSDEFYTRLKASSLNLGDQISLIDIFSEDNGINILRHCAPINDNNYVGNCLSSSMLYEMCVSHYKGFENARRCYSRSIYRCDNCGNDKCFCSECCSILIKCPNCGSDINFANEVIPEDGASDLDSEVTTKLAKTVYYDASEDEWRDIQTHPINGRDWAGLDLFYLGCQTTLSQRTFCSGRFAKWLIDNQLGPVSLIKYPVDVSECNQEELERLNTVAYGEPYISEH
ncbi:MAG: hypothetical protein IJU03_06245 [Thermoguttaceae bacterium]|nr:hypothetical protein [Thermoguttaceae bacterium]